MKILQFKFEDKSLEWRLEQLTFNKLTLLVGASGVGKTQILRALMNLKQIADGSSVNGVNWYIEFKTLSEQIYIWQGEFENKDTSIFSNFEGDEETKKNEPKILSEKFYLNNEMIIERNNNEIFFSRR